MTIGRKLLFILLAVTFLVPFAAHPQARLLTKVGYVDLDRIVFEYAGRYIENEIARHENPVDERAREQREALASLRRDREHLERTGELRNDRVAETVEKNILNAIRKTAEVDLTDRVLRRLLGDVSGAAGEE